jgi:flavin reductase
MLLVCINLRSPLVSAVARSRRFAVNVLASDQGDVADTFAGRPLSGMPWDFRCAEWDRGTLEVPLLRDAAANFECRLHSSRELGTHVVLVGAVVRARRSNRNPLVYAERRYRGLAELVGPQATDERAGHQQEIQERETA